MLAADFELLVDAMVTPERGGSNPEQLTVVGDATFFVATTPTTGAELWKSDGTEAGTVLVKDIRGGRGGSSPTKLTNVGGTLFFVANDATHGAELWASDGTAEGTRMLTNIFGNSPINPVTDLVAVGDDAYFIAPALTGAAGLWRSDGTAAGTTLVRDIGYNSSINGTQRSLIECDGNLFFIGNDALHGPELWKSDGTAAGTTIVRDIAPGYASGLPIYSWQGPPTKLVNVGGVVYFAADNSSTQYNFELWKSDGTTEGTVRVKEINPSNSGSTPQHLTEFNGKLVFLANDGTNGLELWGSDGTAAGTTLLKNVAPFSLSGFTQFSPTPADSPFFTEHQGLMYFVAAEGSSKELWRTDWTSAGTFKVSGVLSTSMSFKNLSLTSSGDALYFMDANGQAFASDGTAAGTTLLKQFLPTFPFNTFPGYPVLGSFTRFGNQLLLVGNTPETGGELWTTDGTAAGTVLLKDIVSGNGSSTPGTPVDFNGSIYFTAAGKLWQSDGTTAESLDVTAGIGGELLTGISNLVVMGDAMYFTATSLATGRELWRADGTTATSTLVKDTIPGTASGWFASLKKFGEKLYFYNDDEQFWESDGTEAGTMPLAQIEYQPSYPLGHLQGSLLLSADDGTGQELWRVDANGAVKLKDFATDDRGGEPDDFIEFHGELYFTAHDGTWYRRELWRTDGTPEGTTLAVDMNGTGRSNIHNLTHFRDELYFTMGDDESVSSLWKSDGTSAGTTRVKVINPTNSGTSIGDLVEAGGFLYFVAEDGVNGFELWRSDGTAEGTFRVMNALPGSASSFPTVLTNVYGTLYFSAYDDVHGEELWKSDGTPERTVFVKDFTPGAGGSAIRWISGVGGGLMVAASTPEYGQEVWSMMPDSRGDYTGDGVTDGADFLAWQRGVGGIVAEPGDEADGNESGGVDFADLAIWVRWYGTIIEEVEELAEAVDSDPSGDDGFLFVMAELVAAEDTAGLTVDSVEEFGSADVGSAVDAAFAWLAGDRAATGHGSWQRSASGTELLSAQSSSIAEASDLLQPAVPPLAMTPREAALGPKRAVPLVESVGRVCAESIMFYPPGIPLLMPGEVVTGEILHVYSSLLEGGAHCYASDPTLGTIRVTA